MLVVVPRDNSLKMSINLQLEGARVVLLSGVWFFVGYVDSKRGSLRQVQKLLGMQVPFAILAPAKGLDDMLRISIMEA